MLAAGCKLVAGKHGGADADAPNVAAGETVFSVDVAPDGSLRVNGVVVRDTGDVTTRAQAAHEQAPDVVAYIHAAPSTPYGRVVEVMDAIKRGRISKVAFGAPPAPPVGR